MVINTGRTESIEKYFEVVQELLDRGFVVLVHDWRRQGLSQRLLADRLKGHVDDFDDFVADFRTLLDELAAQLPKPWIVLGHSMGGGLTMLALTEGEKRFSACVLTSPMLGLKDTPFYARPVAWLSGHVGCTEKQRSDPDDDPYWTNFDKNVFTHDPQRYRRYSDMLAANPELALGAPTYGWIDSALTGIARIQAHAATSIPVVILSAGDDSIVDNASHEAVAARLPNARVVKVPGAFHEILIERDDIRAQFWREFDAVAAAI